MTKMLAATDLRASTRVRVRTWRADDRLVRVVRVGNKSARRIDVGVVAFDWRRQLGVPMTEAINPDELGTTWKGLAAEVPRVRNHLLELGPSAVDYFKKICRDQSSPLQVPLAPWEGAWHCPEVPTLL